MAIIRDHLSDINLSCERDVRPSVWRAWACPPSITEGRGDRCKQCGKPGKGLCVKHKFVVVKKGKTICFASLGVLTFYHRGKGRQVQTLWKPVKGCAKHVEHKLVVVKRHKTICFASLVPRSYGETGANRWKQKGGTRQHAMAEPH